MRTRDLKKWLTAAVAGGPLLGSLPAHADFIPDCKFPATDKSPMTEVMLVGGNSGLPVVNIVFDDSRALKMQISQETVGDKDLPINLKSPKTINEYPGLYGLNEDFVIVGFDATRQKSSAYGVYVTTDILADNFVTNPVPDQAHFMAIEDQAQQAVAACKAEVEGNNHKAAIHKSEDVRFFNELETAPNQSKISNQKPNLRNTS